MPFPSVSFLHLLVALLCTVVNVRTLPIPALRLRAAAFSSSVSATGFEIPFRRSRMMMSKRGDVSGSIGLGDNSDLLYTVPIELGGTTTVVHLDTGSSDLWVISDACSGGACDSANSARVPVASLNNSGASVTMYYGDSTTGTYAGGPIAYDTATIAGVAINNQAYAAVNATTNPIVRYGASGIFGLGFPSGSIVQQSLVLDKQGPSSQTDGFVSATYAYGPLLSRIVTTGALENPMFAISLQRDMIDVSGGTGTLTVGKLPDGIDNSSLTWVPVRLYSPSEGGMQPPSFAPNEVYPYRWEIDIDGVFLDGQELPPSTIPVLGGVNASRTSALIDTGNSLLRGPSDVVQNIISTVSPNNDGLVPCATPHTLAFMIGGKLFPIDPRDFISQNTAGDAVTCQADNIVATDPPNIGALFRFSLGDPFLKSNLVAFHYGNLTHPSEDPPRIGILSMVPQDANAELAQAVQEAQQNGGNFESTLQAAPTASAELEDQTTVFPSSVDWTKSTLATTQTLLATAPSNADITDDDSPPLQTALAKSGALSAVRGRVGLFATVVLPLLSTIFVSAFGGMLGLSLV